MNRRQVLAAAGASATLAVLPMTGGVARATGFDIQGAISALGSNGGIVDVPAGEHPITSTIVVPGNVTVRGAGMGATRVLAMGNHHGFIVKGDYSRVSDLTLDGRGHERPGGGYHGIRLDGGQVGVAVERVRLIDIAGHGITEGLDGGRGLVINECVFDRIGWQGQYLTGYAAIPFRSVEAKITHNTIRGASKWGIEPYVQTTGTYSGSLILGNHISGVGMPEYSPGGGIDVRPGRTRDLIANNVITDCVVSGIKLADTIEAVVTGNVVRNCPVGIEEYGSADWNIIEANNVFGCGITKVGANTRKGQNIQ